MSKWQKELQRIRTNPKNVRFDEIDGLLLGLGFEKRMKGSHAFYKYGKYKLTFLSKRLLLGKYMLRKLCL